LFTLKRAWDPKLVRATHIKATLFIYLAAWSPVVGGRERERERDRRRQRATYPRELLVGIDLGGR
jgi:hypothetical protein